MIPAPWRWPSEEASSFGHNLFRVEDGIGRQRRSILLDRAGSGLERLVLIGKEGFVTLEALAWLRAIGAALVQLGRDGDVLAQSLPYGYDGHPIRRAQALAVTNGLDLAIARELIAAKLDGQRRILVRLRADLREFEKLRAVIDTAESIERVRVIEANAAALYFPAWREVRMRFRPRDLSRIPARWPRADSRGFGGAVLRGVAASGDGCAALRPRGAANRMRGFNPRRDTPAARTSRSERLAQRSNTRGCEHCASR